MYCIFYTWIITSLKTTAYVLCYVCVCVWLNVMPATDTLSIYYIQHNTRRTVYKKLCSSYFCFGSILLCATGRILSLYQLNWSTKIIMAMRSPCENCFHASIHWLFLDQNWISYEKLYVDLWHGQLAGN